MRAYRSTRRLYIYVLTRAQVYGRQLTALVLSPRIDDIDSLQTTNPDAENGVVVADVAVGDSDLQAKYQMKLASIGCTLPEETL